MSRLLMIYQYLLAHYGPQGWWPVMAADDPHPASSGAVHGYHPQNYSFPGNQAEQFEICVGAILTQNTAWVNVETALLNLMEVGVLNPAGILSISGEDLGQAIRPSGYYNMKARKLREFAVFYQALGGRIPDRHELLSVWGIGPETADSIRLYAYKRLEMVVDAYTRRILAHHGLVPPRVCYSELKKFCAEKLPTELVVYQEFHALMVEHAKHCYRRQPYRDPLLDSNSNECDNH